jgi:hypothetical protein
MQGQNVDVGRLNGRDEGGVGTGGLNTMLIERETFNLLCHSIHNLTQEFAKVTNEVTEIKRMLFQNCQNQSNLEGDIRNIAGALNPNLNARQQQNLRRAAEGLDEDDMPSILSAKLADRMMG